MQDDIDTILEPINGGQSMYLKRMPQDVKQEVIVLVNQRTLNNEILCPMNYSNTESSISIQEDTNFILYPNGTVYHYNRYERDEGIYANVYEAKSFGIYNLTESTLTLKLIDYRSSSGGWHANKFEEIYERNLENNSFIRKDGKIFK
jgi:hypothetical protein